MDIFAMFNLSYGMYVVSTKDLDKNVGCVVNTVTQITATPISLSFSTNLDNYTTDAIIRNGRFTVSIISEQVPQKTIGTFGFSSSKDKDKFENISYKTLESGLPVLTNGFCAYLECKVINSFNCYTHKIIVADVVNAEKLCDEKPMTYDYYHNVVKGKAPKNAATYVAPVEK